MNHRCEAKDCKAEAKSVELSKGQAFCDWHTPFTVRSLLQEDRECEGWTGIDGARRCDHCDRWCVEGDVHNGRCDDCRPGVDSYGRRTVDCREQDSHRRQLRREAGLPEIEYFRTSDEETAEKYRAKLARPGDTWSVR